MGTSTVPTHAPYRPPLATHLFAEPWLDAPAEHP